ncbi:incF plasmid conjugative transfer pilus assembly protein traF [Vibrio sp. JCM 19236]|nr:incF plasmid conjugative transfer pilus assembly protein traF [Vibrio sp. JCM 19236]
MLRTTNKILTLSSLAIFSAFAVGQVEQQVEPEFYDDAERGWFWYEQLPEEEKEKFKEKLLQSQPTVIPKSSKPQEEPLSTKWFRENFEKYRDAAIDNPYDQEAMRNYLYLEKFMRDRAVAFAYQRQKAVYEDPFLDSSTQRPTANFGMRSMNIEASKNRTELLHHIGEQSGIYFFYRSDCGFCSQQAPLLAGLEREFQFAIKPVSLDGQPLPESPWSEFLTDSGQAKHLGVVQVPATYLFNPSNNRFELIAQGLQSLTQLQNRIIYAAERAEIISETDVERTRGTGLYQSVDGEYNQFPFPSDAPQEFKDFYYQSIGGQ